MTDTSRQDTGTDEAELMALAAREVANASLTLRAAERVMMQEPFLLARHQQFRRELTSWRRLVDSYGALIKGRQ